MTKETITTFLESLKDMSSEEMAQIYLSQDEFQSLSDDEITRLKETLNLSFDLMPPPRRNTSNCSEEYCQDKVSKHIANDASELTFEQKYEKYYANMKSSASVRAYSWMIISYQLDIQFFSKVLAESYHYAYIKHDKDSVDTHLHIICTFNGKKSALSLFKLLDFDYNKEFQNFKFDPCTNISDRFEYLVHYNNPEKYQYDKSLIVTDNNDYWFTRYKFGESLNDIKQSEKNEIFVDDLLNLSFTAMCRKYGRDFMRYANQYYRAKYVILKESGEESIETDKIIKDLTINFREVKQI